MEEDEQKDDEENIKQTAKNDKFESYLKGAVPTPLVGLSNSGAHTKELKAYLNKRFPNNNENDNYSTNMCSDAMMLSKVNQTSVELQQNKSKFLEQ